MTIAIGDQPATGIQRGRGGFMRNTADVPYVTDSTGATVKSGPRKGEAKRLPYGSPSNRGKQIENTTNLVKWGERRVALGIGLDTEIVELCKHLAGLEVDSDEYKTCADSIIVRAKDVAKANLSADRGTHGHSLTEDFDEDRDWIQRAEAGEIVGLDREVQAALVDAWKRMLERNGLEILAVEASCVDDHWRLAGTLDRIARTTRLLRFARPGGEIVEVPAGTVLVLDVKSGQRRVNDRSGAVLFWQAYAIQIASYAQSVPYDTEAETRGEWPWVIDQSHALIAHLDVLGALDGRPSCELVHVDLVAGREHGGQCVVDAKSWEARTDVFSAAQLDVPVDDAAPGTTPVEPAKGTSTGTTSPATATPPPVKATAEEAPDPTSSANIEDDFNAPMVPTIAPGEQLLPPASRAEPFAWVETSRAAALVPTPQLTIDRNEGSTVHLDAAFNELETEYARLDNAAKAWIVTLTKQAMHADVSFHSSGNRTERRWWTIKGLVAMGIAGLAEDEVLRALVSIAMESEAPLFTAIKPGHAVGALGADGARRFAELVDDVNVGRLVGHIDDAGTFVLRPAA